jgi:DNA ligase D-like protein (predicted ligase)
MQKMPSPLRFIEPMECKTAPSLPEGANWQYEVKFDGYRALAIKQLGEVRLFSRRGKPFDALFPNVAEAVLSLRAKALILDGEIVALDEEGRHSFSRLQNLRSKRAPLQFFAFDLLHLDGEDLLRVQLRKRRALLGNELRASAGVVRVSPVLKCDLATALEKVREFEFEGAIAKRVDSLYEPGKASGAWLKYKTQRSDDFIVGGYVPGDHGLDELIIGRLEGRQLLFVDSVRNGFRPATRRQVFEVLKLLHVDECPFVNLPEKKGVHRMDREKMREVQWVEPKLIAEVAFNEMTPHGHLRHSKFLRLRLGFDLKR